MRLRNRHGLSAFLILIIFLKFADSENTKMCGQNSRNYANAAKTYPRLREAIETVQNEPIAVWYSDRENKAKKVKEMKQLLADCAAKKQRPTIVIYGLPEKDCKDGFSSTGYNKNAKDYQMFITIISSIIADSHAIVVMEPDAVGLSIDGECGIKAKYIENMHLALKILQKGNKNIDIYIDVGFWTLISNDKAKSIVKVITKIDSGKNVKGIGLNTSNYRTTKEMAEYCEKFNSIAKSTSKKNYHCVIDTSRNFQGPSPKEEWCNVKNAGIGAPPSANTKIDVIDYFLWIKPPGESDGECHNRTSDARKGPKAGEFFPEAFSELFENSYYTKKNRSKSNYGVVVVILIAVLAFVVITACVLTVKKKRRNRLKRKKFAIFYDYTNALQIDGRLENSPIPILS